MGARRQRHLLAQELRGRQLGRRHQGRDAVWAHPDLLPTAADLDDPLGFREGVPEPEALTDAEFDAALAEMLDSAGGAGPARSSEVETSSDVGDSPGSEPGSQAGDETGDDGDTGDNRA